MLLGIRIQKHVIDTNAHTGRKNSMAEQKSAGCFVPGCLILVVGILSTITALYIGTESGPKPARETPAARRTQTAPGLTPAEADEARHLHQLMDRETAMGNCIAIATGPCDCTAQAVEFVRAMQNEDRMSMTRRRRLSASQELAELCLAVEEGVSLSDMVRQ